MSKQTQPCVGAYARRSFAPGTEELERLKLQATIAREQEQAAWKQAGLQTGMHVLDVGCGPGFTSCELARFVGPNGSVTGVDVNQDLLQVAEQVRTSESIPHVTFQHADLYQQTLPADTYDFAYARFVFQHLPDPAHALQEIRRALKPGGILCILDVDDNWISFYPAMRACARFIRQAQRAQQRTGGNRRIGSQLNSYLQEAGYQEVQTRIVPLTSQEIGLRMFLGVAILFRLELLNPLQRMRAWPLLRSIRRAAQTPHAWGGIGLFFSSGRKPV